MQFKDQVVLVTGGTRGIGAAISKRFLNEGARVIATFLGNQEAANVFWTEMASYQDRLEVRACDVSSSVQVSSLFEHVREKYGAVHVLVNNAGIRRDGIVALLSEEDWDSVLSTNLKSCFLTSKQAVQCMSGARYGRIINITSPSGEVGFPGQGNYSASKAGQVGFSRSLAKEVAKRNITVNCVSPGFIETDLLKDLNEGLKEKYRHLVPMERFGYASEVAYAVTALASREASYITGALLEVAGGL